MTTIDSNGDNPRAACADWSTFALRKTRMSRHPFALLAAPALFLLLTSCANLQNPDRDASPPWRQAKPPETTTKIFGPGTPGMGGPGSDSGSAGGGDASRIYKGTGQLVKGQQLGGGLPAATPGAVATGPSVALNFEAADLRDVVRNILTDILNESYTIEPQVGGTVTIRTTTGIPREALPATLEMLLRMNGAAMVKEGGIWKIVPAAAAVRGNLTPQLGNSTRALPPGYSVQIVPLRFMSARQM